MARPFPVSEYIANNSDTLDAKSFAAMRDAGSVEELPDRNSFRRLTAASGWRKRWNHWGGLGCFSTGVSDDNLELTYFRCEEEGVYV